MKKRIGLITIAMVLSLSACGSSASQGTTVATTAKEQTETAAETTVEEKQEETKVEETTAPETTAAPPVKKETMGIAEFSDLLGQLPITIDEKEYVVQDDRYKNIYPDMLQVIIHNHTDADIKNAELAFVAWDKNKLPIKIKGQFDFSDGSYVQEVLYNDINLVPDSTFGDSSGFALDENNTIDSFEAIVTGFETFDGDKWENPYYDEWRKLYEGVKYSDDLTVEVKVEDNADFAIAESSAESTKKDVDEDALTAEIEAQDVRVISTEYIVQDKQYKSLYPDMLSAVIQNDTDLDIKNAVIAFVAWDKNNLPVKLKGNTDINDGTYIKEVSCSDINLVPGETYGEDKGFAINENINVNEFKAIVVSYEAFDGTKWRNPCYSDWRKLYEGVKRQ